MKKVGGSTEVNGRKSFQDLLCERILSGDWGIDLKKIFSLFTALKPIDYAILLYSYNNFYDKRPKFIQSTNLMWELGLTPTHYTDVRLGLVRLTETGFLSGTPLPLKQKCGRPFIGYKLTTKGSNFVSVLIGLNNTMSGRQIKVLLVEDKAENEPDVDNFL